MKHNHHKSNQKKEAAKDFIQTLITHMIHTLSVLSQTEKIKKGAEIIDHID